MRNRYYRLDEHGNPVACSLMEWATFFEKKAERRVALTIFGDFEISTVFLGLDHNWGEVGPPILWETMVFGNMLGKSDGDDMLMDRCSGNREQAEAMHERMVDRIVKDMDQLNKKKGQS